MTKTEWEKAYHILDKCHTDYYDSYHDYKNGKNQSIRKSAERKVYSAITRAKTTIERYPEILDLYMASEFGHPYADDEFWQARHFGRDMSRFLTMIREKIDCMDNPIPDN